MKKWTVILIYLLIIGFAFAYRHEILHMIKYHRLPVYAAILFAAFCSFFSFMPYSLVIGAMGFVYGAIEGAFISWAGSLIATMVMFVLVRYIFRSKESSLNSRHPALVRFTELFANHSFLAILAARMAPFVPQHLISIYSALSAVPVAIFVLASALGKVPGMLVYAFIGGSILHHSRYIAIIIGCYVVFLAAVFQFMIKCKSYPTTNSAKGGKNA
jgi:uncharacterized membrane protein YdjX (TVP38/TMEM64 family)